MFKYNKHITNSTIVAKYINKTYQHKNKCLYLKPDFKKGDNLNTNRAYPLHSNESISMAAGCKWYN